jgi:hypothetical protein
MRFLQRQIELEELVKGSVWKVIDLDSSDEDLDSPNTLEPKKELNDSNKTEESVGLVDSQKDRHKDLEEDIDNDIFGVADMMCRHLKEFGSNKQTLDSRISFHIFQKCYNELGFSNPIKDANMLKNLIDIAKREYNKQNGLRFYENLVSCQFPS